MSNDTRETREIDINAGRRSFMRSVGLASIAAGTFAAGTVSFGPPAAAARLTDADVLNFALNLEYLEAEFYLHAVKGSGLADRDVDGVGRDGPVKGGSKVNFSDANVRSYAREVADDEEKHVQFLRKALGKAAVARPKIDLRDSFTAAAVGAGLIAAGETFDPFADDDSFLIGAFIFEDVGVTAYKAAIDALSDKGNIGAAAGIMAVEAYHAGEIRTLMYGRGLFDAAKGISNFRASVGNGKDQPIWRGGEANIVPADANGLAYGRPPEEVLPIVYLGGSRKGGFYPAGLNGKIDAV